MAKKATLEESFDAIEQIIAQLESGDLTLEESFQRYEEGMKAVKHCNTAIERVEKKLEIINGGEQTE